MQKFPARYKLPHPHSLPVYPEGIDVSSDLFTLRIGFKQDPQTHCDQSVAECSKLELPEGALPCVEVAAFLWQKKYLYLSTVGDICQEPIFEQQPFALTRPIPNKERCEG